MNKTSLTYGPLDVKRYVTNTFSIKTRKRGENLKAMRKAKTFCQRNINGNIEDVY